MPKSFDPPPPNIVFGQPIDPSTLARALEAS
jgi:hypothetical protein